MSKKKENKEEVNEPIETAVQEEVNEKEESVEEKVSSEENTDSTVDAPEDADADKEAVEEVVKEKVEKADKDIPLEVYKVGNLKFKCHACEYEYTIEEGIQGGVRFDLYPTNKHKLAMACPQCKAVMEMFFERGDETGLTDLDGNPLKSDGPKNEDTVEQSNEDTDGDEPLKEDENIIGVEDMEMSEEMPESVKEEIISENSNKDEVDENSVQEESKQETSV